MTKTISKECKIYEAHLGVSFDAFITDVIVLAAIANEPVYARFNDKTIRVTGTSTVTKLWLAYLNATDGVHTCNCELLHRAKAAVKAVDDLISESTGVVGLHRNGDIAPWQELIRGGRFEKWLRAVDELRDHIAESKEP